MNLSNGGCQFCASLRQLVFQAKDCIDDLKDEVEEWKNACALKDAELRSIYHKLYNDKLGMDKKLEFSADVRIENYS